MMKPSSYRFRVFYFLLFVLIFLVGFPVLVFYSAGYSWDQTFGLSARGGIYVFTPEPNTSVFIGNELKNVSGFFNKEVLVNNLKPNNYLVLATNEKFWPWAKIVQVERGEVEALTPLLVPKVIDTQEILKTDSVRKTLTALFATTTISSSVTKIGTSTPPNALVKKGVQIWHEGNALFAQWLGENDAAPEYFCEAGGCTKSIKVFQSFVPIRTADFYPGRDDAIILALDNGIYVIEIDRRPTQNFYPLYRGQEPDFRIYRGQVYIKDSDYIAALNLQS